MALLHNSGRNAPINDPIHFVIATRDLMIPTRASADVVAFEFAVERGAADAEHAVGQGFVTFDLFEDALDCGTFDLFQISR